jgi:hypothetical protein
MNLILANALQTLMALPAPERAPVEDAPPLPVVPPIPLDAVGEYAQDVARRAATRAGYEVTGFVLTQKTRGDKCIVDGTDAAWIAGEQAKELLKWKRPKQKPAPWVDETPPETEDEGERALRVLANRLGIPFNSIIPHNSGFFVPGIPNAYASAGEAIEALFERIYTAPDATVYRPGKPGRAAGTMPPVVITGTVDCIGEIVAAPPAPEVTSAQALFERAAAKVAKKPAPAPVETPQMSMF